MAAAHPRQRHEGIYGCAIISDVFPRGIGLGKTDPTIRELRRSRLGHMLGS